jgi:hypothetical protein
MLWRERVEQNCQDLIDAEAKLKQTLDQKHQVRLRTLLAADRCMRCGNVVVPFFKVPGPYLCIPCQKDIKALDGCTGDVKWFSDIPKRYIEEK